MRLSLYMCFQIEKPEAIYYIWKWLPFCINISFQAFPRVVSVSSMCTTKRGCCQHHQRLQRLSSPMVWTLETYMCTHLRTCVSICTARILFTIYLVCLCVHIAHTFLGRVFAFFLSLLYKSGSLLYLATTAILCLDVMILHRYVLYMYSISCAPDSIHDTVAIDKSSYFEFIHVEWSLCNETVL